MYDMKITTTRRVRRMSSPAIDLYLPQEELDVIYDRWGQGVTQFGWDIPLSMRGGITTITCEMVKKVPLSQLEKVYYKKRTQRILNAIARVS